MHCHPRAENARSRRRKAADFDIALAAMLDQAVASTDSADLNFKGFVLPKVDFRDYVFRGVADFRGAVFAGDSDFRSAVFLQQADFHTTEFRKYAGFFGAVFASNAQFLGTKFGGRAIFSGGKFRGSTAFHGCSFADFAAWQGAKFDMPVIFQSNTFEQDADFRQAVFYNGVDFHQSKFKRRVNFEATRFHREVLLTETHIAFLKKLDCRHANMNGAVLHTAQIWENERLSYYSFRDAFLISVNLAGKELPPVFCRKQKPDKDDTGGTTSRREAGASNRERAKPKRCEGSKRPQASKAARP